MNLTSKQVAIVCLATDRDNAKLLADLGHPVPRVVFYSVTLDPARLSETGEFIRFGQWGDGAGQGDEITGWIPVKEIVVREVLAEWDGTQFRPFVQSAERAA